MTKAAQIVDALGGTVKVANALDLTPSTVSSWKGSGKIPRWWMRDINALAQQTGVDLDNLPRPTKSASAAA